MNSCNPLNRFIKSFDTSIQSIKLIHSIDHSNSFNTFLQVDEIIMAKPAGGPKPQKKSGWDEDPDE